MTNPKPLTPAAQAVWDAAWSDTAIQCGDIKGTRRSQVAAALRAAADQVVPKGYSDAYDCCLTIIGEIREELLAIAGELEQA